MGDQLWLTKNRSNGATNVRAERDEGKSLKQIHAYVDQHGHSGSDGKVGKQQVLWSIKINGQNLI